MEKPRITRYAGKYVISLPDDWAREIEQKYSSQLDMKIVNDKVVLSPPLDRTSPIIGELDIEGGGERDLENAIVAMYMRGYDGMNFKGNLSSVQFRKAIISTSEKLYGVTVRKTSSKEYNMMIADVVERRFDTLVGRMHRLIGDAYSRLLESFENYPDAKIMVPNGEAISDLEEELDKISFYSKRLISKALIYPEVLNESGLKDPRNSIHLGTLISNLERVGDLHKEISDTLERMAKRSRSKDGDFAIMTLKSFYADCAKLVLGASKPSANLEEITSLRNTTKMIDPQNGIEYLDTYPLEKRMLAIDAIKSSHTPYELFSVEGKIWALAGHAKNIAEAVFNIRIVQ